MSEIIGHYGGEKAVRFRIDHDDMLDGLVERIDKALRLAGAPVCLVDVSHESHDFMTIEVQNAHCLSRNCLRGSPAGNKETAILDPTTFRRQGCECACYFCRNAPINEGG